MNIALIRFLMCKLIGNVVILLWFLLSLQYQNNW